MALYPYEFEAPLSRHFMGTNARGDLYYTVLYVPQNILDDLNGIYKPRLRVEGEISDLPFAASLMPSRGKIYILVPKALMKAIRQTMAYDLHDCLPVRFKVANQKAVEVPQALAQALEENKQARIRWEALTAGKKRSLAYRVSAAKTSATISKRLAEVFDVLGYAP